MAQLVRVQVGHEEFPNDHQGSMVYAEEYECIGNLDIEEYISFKYTDKEAARRAAMSIRNNKKRLEKKNDCSYEVRQRKEVVFVRRMKV